MRRRNKASRRKFRMRAAILGLTVIAIVFSSLAYRLVPPGWLPSTASIDPPRSGVVTKVIDGDTIELGNGMKVRYIGLDTPELRKRLNQGWVYQPEPLAEEAKAMNRRLVEGRNVRLEYDQEAKDRYSRWLAYVFAGDVFVNAALIEAGYARVTLYPPNLKHAATFLKLQEAARESGRGIWAVEAPAEWRGSLLIEPDAG